MEYFLTTTLCLSLTAFTYQLACYIKYHKARNPSEKKISAEVAIA